MLSIIQKWDCKNLMDVNSDKNKLSSESEPSVGESSNTKSARNIISSLSNSRTRLTSQKFNLRKGTVGGDKELKQKNVTDFFPFKFETLDTSSGPGYNMMKMFQESFKYRPGMSEIECTPVSKKKYNSDKLSILPCYAMIFPEVFQKMELDTLFFASKFDGENKHKNYAVKELQNRGWTFNSKQRIWVQKQSGLVFDADGIDWEIKRM